MPGNKMSDLTNPPKGAAHYNKNTLGFYKYSANKDKMYYLSGNIWIELNHWPPRNAVKKISAKAEQWNIYNNTLPLCELSDDQAAMLFNAWRKAGSIMCKHYTDEIFVDIKDAKWADKFVYRIKPKSERELFIDKSKLIIGATTDDELVDAVIADLFDAGARYKDLTQQFGENI